MTPREIVIAQISHEETPVVPYTFTTEPMIAKALTAHYGSEDAWQGRLIPYIESVGGQDTAMREDVDADGDGVRQIDPFGTVWQMDGATPHVETPAMAEPSFDSYEFPSAETFILDEDVPRACGRVAEDWPSFRVLHMGWGLLEHAWAMRGFEAFMEDLALREEFVQKLLDKLTDMFLAFIDHWSPVNADAVMFGDDWGDQRGVIGGPERWRRLIKPRWARIYQRAHEAGWSVITHCCGSVAEIMDDIVEIGLDVLESVQPEAAGMNPYELKKRYGANITFWGGLGSQSTMQFATPDEVRDEIRKLRTEMSVGGGYILAPAKLLQPGTPIENAIAAFETFIELQ
ncbi:MAG: uroporphyrinogen decarboxylase family protein [Planctomycetota bacterium]|jgi:uroporphyrinogen decarboxylase